MTRILRVPLVGAGVPTRGWKVGRGRKGVRGGRGPGTPVRRLGGERGRKGKKGSSAEGDSGAERRIRKRMEGKREWIEPQPFLTKRIPIELSSGVPRRG
jgi:hypothetical protein